MDRKRKRPKRIYFRLNSQEFEELKTKMQEAGMNNREEFIRQMLRDGYIINVDISGINALSVQISRYGNNINQIAKRVNETNHIYKEDINEIASQQASILASLKDLFKSMSFIAGRR